MRYEFYADVFWATNFVLDACVLLLLGCVKRKIHCLKRILAASIIGASGTICLFLVLNSFSLYQLLVHFLLNPMVVFIAFPERKIKDFFVNYVITYILMLLLGGVISWGMENFGQWNYFWIWFLGGIGICLLIIHWRESKKIEKMEYEVLLLLEGKSISLKGYWDSGNLLMDPLVQQPVHIIQQELLQKELESLQLPVRYIPFHSLGQENGLLPVVTLKAMYLKRTEERTQVKPVFVEKPVFGLAKEKLFQNKEYQIILNANCNLP